MSPPTPHCRAGRVVWATLAFMAGFAILLAYVSRSYLIPALEAASTATPDQKKALSAHASLLLVIVLLILVSGILLTFRFGRYILPRKQEKAPPTRYVDAWEEAGKRLQLPREDDGDDDNEETRSIP